MYPRHDWQEELTGPERIRGGLLLVLYFILFPFFMARVQRAIGGEAPVAELNVIYYLLLGLTALLLLRAPLFRDFNVLLDGLPRSLGALAAGLCVWAALGFLLDRIPLPVEDPTPWGWAAEFAMSPAATLILLLVLIPMVEETVFRGFLFRLVRPWSPVLAYVVSGGGFALYCVWQLVFSYGRVDLRYLLLAMRWLPAGLALTWCCDRSRSVWAAVLLHGTIDGLVLLRTLSAV